MEDLIRTVQDMEAYLKTFSETILIRLERVEGKLEDLSQAKSANRRQPMEVQEAERPQQELQQARPAAPSNSAEILSKTYTFFSTKFSIPSFTHAISSDNPYFQGIWAILISITFLIGISLLATLSQTYYNFETVSNTELVTPTNFSMPAVSICSSNAYTKTRYYKNGTLIKQEAMTYNDSISIGDFIAGSTLYPVGQSELEFNKTQIKVFAAPNKTCLRLLEMVTFQRQQSLDELKFTVKNVYNDSILNNQELTIYTLLGNFQVFIGDKRTLSFYKIMALDLPIGKSNYITIGRVATEQKLPEPYNSCEESEDNAQYHQSNCIENCVFREMAVRYNCTFDGFYAVDGLGKCTQSPYAKFEDELSSGCERECPALCESTVFRAEKQVKELAGGVDGQTEFTFTVSDFSYLSISQTPKIRVSSFVANVGGILFIFMGISVLTLVELVMILSEIIFIYFS